MLFYTNKRTLSILWFKVIYRFIALYCAYFTINKFFLIFSVHHLLKGVLLYSVIIKSVSTEPSHQFKCSKSHTSDLLTWNVRRISLVSVVAHVHFLHLNAVAPTLKPQTYFFKCFNRCLRCYTHTHLDWTQNIPTELKYDRSPLCFGFLFLVCLFGWNKWRRELTSRGLLWINFLFHIFLYS